MFIGLMSGTSMDAVDCVLVEFQGHRSTLIETLHYPIPPTLKKTARDLIQAQKIHFDDLGYLEHAFGELFAQSVLELLKKAKIFATQIRAIGSHGQTLWHNPRGNPSSTLQVGDPNWIAARTNIMTIADFRRVDLAYGGQGAPLVPRFHAATFRDPNIDRVIINLGGICNITVLPCDLQKPVLGWDIGPANAILDALAEKYFNQPYDPQGSIAATGTVVSALLEDLLRDPYFQLAPPKSTGKEYFHLDWLASYGDIENKADLLATATELTTILIAKTIQATFAKAQVFVCGGGIFNEDLMIRLKQHLGDHYSLGSTALGGLDPRWVEATCFAWLAERRLSGLPGNLPSVTGASQEAILGAIYAV